MCHKMLLYSSLVRVSAPLLALVPVFANSVLIRLCITQQYNNTCVPRVGAVNLSVCAPPVVLAGDGPAANMFKGLGGGSRTVSKINFTYSYTFNKAGTYDYHCHNHPYTMGGQVIVKKKCALHVQYTAVMLSSEVQHSVVLYSPHAVHCQLFAEGCQALAPVTFAVGAARVCMASH